MAFLESNWPTQETFSLSRVFSSGNDLFQYAAPLFPAIPSASQDLELVSSHVQIVERVAMNLICELILDLKGAQVLDLRSATFGTATEGR